MSEMKVCQGPKCHEYRTKDRIRGSKGDNEESIKRVERVWESGQFTDEEMSWVMLLLIMPKVNKMIKETQEWKEFKTMKESLH